MAEQQHRRRHVQREREQRRERPHARTAHEQADDRAHRPRRARQQPFAHEDVRRRCEIEALPLGSTELEDVLRLSGGSGAERCSDGQGDREVHACDRRPPPERDAATGAAPCKRRERDRGQQHVAERMHRRSGARAQSDRQRAPETWLEQQARKGPPGGGRRAREHAVDLRAGRVVETGPGRHRRERGQGAGTERLGRQQPEGAMQAHGCEPGAERRGEQQRLERRHADGPEQAVQRADDVQVGDVTRVFVASLFDPAEEHLAVDAVQRPLRQQQEHRRDDEEQPQGLGPTLGPERLLPSPDLDS